MKSIVLRYGTISGLWLAALLLVCIPLAPKIGYETSWIIIFFGKLIAFIPVFFAIRYYKKTVGEGFVTFGKAFNTGIFIVVLASVFYALAWMMLYYYIVPGFMDKYFQYGMAQLKLRGALPKDIADFQNQFQESKKILDNPFICFAGKFSDDQLFYGVIITLISSVILRKNPPPSVTAIEVENIQ